MPTPQVEARTYHLLPTRDTGAKLLVDDAVILASERFLRIQSQDDPARIDLLESFVHAIDADVAPDSHSHAPIGNVGGVVDNGQYVVVVAALDPQLLDVLSELWAGIQRLREGTRLSHCTQDNSFIKPWSGYAHPPLANEENVRRRLVDFAERRIRAAVCKHCV